MGFDFSALYIVYGLAVGAIVGFVLSIILFAVGIGVQIAPWMMFLSFGVPIVIGFIWGAYKAERN